MKNVSAAKDVLLALLLVLAGCSTAPSRANYGSRQQAPPSGASAAPELLSAAGQAQMASLLEKSRLDELQWPNFSDFAPQAREFYDKAGHAPAWSRGGKPTQQAIDTIQRLQQANEKGLNSKDYDGERWAARLNSLAAAGSRDEAQLVNFDVALTVSAMRYAMDLHLGKVNPRTLHTDFEPDRNEYDLADFLCKRVTTAANPGEAFARIEPPYPGYQRALAALAKYTQMAQEEKMDLLPTVAKPIAPGQPYGAVAKLIDRLKFLGDLPPKASLGTNPALYEGDAVTGVKRFQARHGLEAEGKLGPETVAELNRPMSDRVRQLKLALERWRWVPHNFDQPPIVVNIPEFRLRAYDEQGRVAVSMKVVVGRAMRTQTPVMEQDMKYVIFWPYWNVPPSIARLEIIPKLAKDRDYLEKNGFEATTLSGEVVGGGTLSDEMLAQLKAGKLTIRQKPGAKNALGLIKFIFPNDNNVYLHSTPAQSLFSQSRRDFSHGCIRVEEPGKLAEYVLRNNPGWSKERIEAAFAAQKQEQVNLAKTIPVLVVYGTAVVAEDGTDYFFSDIYGFDKQLDKLCCDFYTPRK